MIISVFLPGVGCPKDKCVYCNQELATSQQYVDNKDDMYKRIEESISKYLGNGGVEYPVEVAFYGGNFTALDFGLQKDLIRHVQSFFEKTTGKNYNDNLRIRFSTRPDAVVREQLLDLKIRFNLRTVELGVQSMDDDVLYMCRRGHTPDDVVYAAKVIKELGLTLSCHQMIGLPGATVQSDVNTAREIAKLKPDFVRVHPTLVLKDSKLEDAYRKGEYIPLTIDEAVHITEKVVAIYRDSNIKVIRVGLHPSDTLAVNVVAGPWHPSFRELVEGRLLYNKAYTVIADKTNNYIAPSSKNSVKLLVSPKDETYMRGKDNSNIEELKRGFALADIVVIKDPRIERGALAVELAE